jgi:glucokinase
MVRRTMTDTAESNPQMSTTLLVGDIGGTKTLLRLVDPTGVALVTERFESKGPGLGDIVARFLAMPAVNAFARPRVAVFGVAGPVLDDLCATTNLPWFIDARILERELGIPRVRLLNDFEANAYGVPAVAPDRLFTLQPGSSRPRAPIAVIGAGTGLGEAILAHNGEDYVVLPTEGGHADFAPRNELEDRVLRRLRARYGRVSIERVVSGLGMADVYAELRALGVEPESPTVAQELASGDAGPVIGEHAIAGDDPLCVRTIEFFVSAYGAEAGNFALRTLSRGGVYITGGIAPKLLPKLSDSGLFLRAFRDKGRMSDLVAQIPVHVVLDPELALLGAFCVATAVARQT